MWLLDAGMPLGIPAASLLVRKRRHCGGGGVSGVLAKRGLGGDNSESCVIAQGNVSYKTDVISI
jgi:hypothetical protein